MNRISIGLFLAGLLGTMPLLAQSPVDDLSKEQLTAIAESRRIAFQELKQRSAAFEFPEIANALSWPSYLIAIAKITSVDLPNPGLLGDAHIDSITSSILRLRTTIIYFHVEQLLRGDPEITDFTVESRWAPKSPEEDVDSGFSCDGQCSGFLHLLDRTEPKPGDLYVLGYIFDYASDKRINVAFALDMQDPAQSRLLGDIEQFLRAESAPGPSGFESYLEELNSPAPWVRDLAIRHLSESESCNASSDCAKRFMAAVIGQIKSNIPNERLQALYWLAWVDSVSEMHRSAGKLRKGLPVLPDSVVRELLETATRDANVYVGDEAFRLLELSDFRRSGKPGNCIQVVPPLRKSTYRQAEATDPLPPGFPLVSVTSCIPVQKTN